MNLGLFLCIAAVVFVVINLVATVLIIADMKSGSKKDVTCTWCWSIPANVAVVSLVISAFRTKEFTGTNFMWYSVGTVLVIVCIFVTLTLLDRKSARERNGYSRMIRN